MDTAVLYADVLVLGGGIAGHRAAIAASGDGRRVIMAHFAKGASPFVLGCNTPIGHADPRDNPEIYYEDMVRGGYGLNDRRIVEVMAKGAGEAQRELAEIGVPFAQENGRLLQRHLSGNTYRRSIYVADGTGKTILQHLAERCRNLGVESLSGRKVVNLLQDQGEVVGALLWDRQNGLCAVVAKAVVVALGGIGKLYKDSTYPPDVSCHGYGLALEAGACLIDMEFVQFEPVVTVWPEDCAGMEMPTAMLGDGAHLVNAVGERFMFRYNPGLGEKGIEKARMSLCIQQEIDQGRGFPDGSVVFDTTVVPRVQLESYVSHCKRLRNAGVDPVTQSPRVRPAAHSQMGGVFIDQNGWSGVPGLYVGGETAGGAHGASRLAGNGCSDTLVLGALAGRGAAASIVGKVERNCDAAIARAVDALKASVGRSGQVSAEEIKSDLRDVMHSAAGIWRHGDTAAQGVAKLKVLRSAVADLPTPDLPSALETLEVQRMVQVGSIIVDAALNRMESRGAHQRTDFPQRDDQNFMIHLGYRINRTGEIEREVIPIH